MKLTKNNTCNRCKADDESFYKQEGIETIYRHRCKLGFKQRGQFMAEAYPLELCPKPLTVAEFKKLYNEAL